MSIFTVSTVSGSYSIPSQLKLKLLHVLTPYFFEISFNIPPPPIYIYVSKARRPQVVCNPTAFYILQSVFTVYILWRECYLRHHSCLHFLWHIAAFRDRTIIKHSVLVPEHKPLNGPIFTICLIKISPDHYVSKSVLNDCFCTQFLLHLHVTCKRCKISFVLARMKPGLFTEPWPSFRQYLFHLVHSQ